MNELFLDQVLFAASLGRDTATLYTIHYTAVHYTLHHCILHRCILHRAVQSLVSAVQSDELDLPAYCKILKERIMRDKVRLAVQPSQ